MPLVQNPQLHRSSSDDLSNRVERILIGAIGVALPTLLVTIAGLRPEDPQNRWTVLPSISAYYYTGAVAAFVGLLVTLAIFLFSYQGYENRWHALDVWTARIAATASLGVAFFPTSAPDGYTAAPWWMPAIGIVHYVSATILFSSFAFFALYLFRRTDQPGPRSRDKQWRDAAYLICGFAIVVAIAWTAVRGFSQRPIFGPESMALVFFAISWLVKGRAFEVIWHAVRPPTPAVPR